MESLVRKFVINWGMLWRKFRLYIFSWFCNNELKFRKFSEFCFTDIWWKHFPLPRTVIRNSHLLEQNLDNLLGQTGFLLISGGIYFFPGHKSRNVNFFFEFLFRRAVLITTFPTRIYTTLLPGHCRHLQKFQNRWYRFWKLSNGRNL